MENQREVRQRLGDHERHQKTAPKKMTDMGKSGETWPGEM
jgi:hypothetical protein